jgi:cytoskeletal protein RodZ
MPTNSLNNSQKRIKSFPKNKELGVSTLVVLVFILILLIAASLVTFYFYTVNKNTTSDTVQNPEAIKTMSDSEVDAYIEQYNEGEWDPRQSPVSGEALRVIDDQDKIVEVKFSWPIEIADKIVEVKLTCDETDYSIDTRDYPFGEESEDGKPESISSSKFMELLKEPIVVIRGFCIDKECKVIDKGCVLRVL